MSIRFWQTRKSGEQTKTCKMYFVAHAAGLSSLRQFVAGRVSMLQDTQRSYLMILLYLQVNSTKYKLSANVLTAQSERVFSLIIQDMSLRQTSEENSRRYCVMQNFYSTLVKLFVMINSSLLLIRNHKIASKFSSAEKVKFISFLIGGGTGSLLRYKVAITISCF